MARYRAETTSEAVAIRLETDRIAASQRNKDYSGNSDSAPKGRNSAATAAILHSVPEGYNSPSPWLADGRDLQHIVVTAVDKKGRVVPTANADITFSVDGPADLIAVSSGDHYSDELNVTNHRRLYDGRCLVILRAGRTPGKVTLTATVPGLKPAKLVLTSK